MCVSLRVQSSREMTDNSSPEPTPRKLIIAIDGPAGAGKSTIASRLARKLGYVNLESGAMYRALALKAIEKDASFDDESTLVKLAQESRIQLEPTRDGNRTLLNGHDVSSRIRERDVTEAASRVSVHPAGAPVDGGSSTGDGCGRRRGDGGPRHWNESFSRR